MSKIRRLVLLAAMAISAAPFVVALADARKEVGFIEGWDNRGGTGVSMSAKVEDSASRNRRSDMARKKNSPTASAGVSRLTSALKSEYPELSGCLAMSEGTAPIGCWTWCRALQCYFPTGRKRNSLFA